MSSKQQYLKKGNTEEQYKRWARRVGKKIDYQKKFRQVVDACESPWAVIERRALQVDRCIFPRDFERCINTDNPMQIFYNYLFYRNFAQSCGDHLGALANTLSRVKESCFIRWGDRNYITAEIRKNWFSPDAIEMDTLAQEASSISGIQIWPEDIVEFINMHPGGVSTYIHFERVAQLEAAWKRLTGFRLTSEFVDKFNGEYLKNTTFEHDPSLPF